VDCRSIPGCLPELTWLEGLHWRGELGEGPEEGAEQLEVMLGPLRQLTYLCFHDTCNHVYWDWCVSGRHAGRGLGMRGARQHRAPGVCCSTGADGRWWLRLGERVGWDGGVV